MEGMLSPTSLMPTYNVSIGVYRCDFNEFIKSFNLYYEINPMLVILQVQRDDASREGEREGDDDDEGPPPARPWIAAHGPAPAPAPHAGTRYRLTHRDKLVLMTNFQIFCMRLQNHFIISNNC